MDDHDTDSALDISDSGSGNCEIQLDTLGVPLMKPKCLDEYSHGITLAWRDVSVSVPMVAKNSGFFRKTVKNRKYKRVLNNVTGIVHPGTLTALMGASGAGKTTLMTTLGCKTKGDIEISGEILVNGVPSMEATMGDISGFVYQDDLFIGTLTVAEHLNFMASLKLGRRMSESDRGRRVEELLIDLSLKKCANSRIGIPTQQTGISGGERKRLAFATEILTNPSILFCDEPTTGLDSFSAKTIVRILKTMAIQGKTILCTIHQPSSQVFSMFDQFCFLAEGRTAFMGSSEGALAFMSTLGFQCPPHYNVADFYIRNLTTLPKKEFESRTSVNRICNAYTKTAEADAIQYSIINEITKLKETTSVDSHISLRHKKKLNWLKLTTHLTWRAFVSLTRNRKLLKIRFLQSLIVGTVLGLCFSGTEMNQDGIQNVQGIAFSCVSQATFPALLGALYIFPAEFPLFMRERKSNLYGVSSYYIAKMLAQIPSHVLEAIVFTTPAYLLAGLRPTFQDYFLTCAVMILSINVAGAAGCFCSAASDSISKATQKMQPVNYILMLTGGHFLSLRSLPLLIVWAKYFSWVLYTYEAISIIQWRGITNITCDAVQSDKCITTGEEVLRIRGFAETDLEFDYIGLIILFFFMHIGGYISLLIKSRRQ